MADNYTMMAEDLILDLPEMDKAALWADLQAMPMDTPAEDWKRKLSAIAREYVLSTRFALMRLLSCRAWGNSLFGPEGASGQDFQAEAGGRLRSFREITMDHALAMTPAESEDYLALLQEMARKQADYEESTARNVIERAWFDEESANRFCESRLDPRDQEAKAARKAYEKENHRKFRNRLSRQECFLLGHVLDFSFREMQWFLLRTQDQEESFRFNRSEDLLEAYGFLTGSSFQKVLELKEAYAARTEEMPKDGDFRRAEGFTMDMAATLPELVEQWRRDVDTMEENFLRWMVSRAPGLDVPSRTAGRICRNLAACVYGIAEEEAPVPEESELPDLIRELCQEEETEDALRLLYRDGELCPRQVKKAADGIMRVNKEIVESDRPDNTVAWSVVSVAATGDLTSAGGLVNTGRTRLADVLLGRVQAEKGDALYLLWFLANLIWVNDRDTDADTVCCRIMDFMDAARLLLEEALLPEFYPPHPMEQSMLLSIAAGDDPENNPAQVYGRMLESLRAGRKKEGGYRKHDQAFWVEVVRHYRADPELSLSECALQFGVSPKSLSAKQKELLEKGLVE